MKIQILSMFVVISVISIVGLSATIENAEAKRQPLEIRCFTDERVRGIVSNLICDLLTINGKLDQALCFEVCTQEERPTGCEDIRSKVRKILCLVDVIDEKTDRVNDLIDRFRGFGFPS